MSRIDEITATARYYDLNGTKWADTKTNSFFHEPEFRKFISYLPKHASVIDIGCAQGIHVPLFLGIGRSLQYTGIDISKTFLKLATSRYPQLSFKLANIAEKKTLPKKKFGGFFAAAVLMHVPFSLWDSMFKNIEGITKPSSIGYIVLPIEHPSENSPTSDSRHYTILPANGQRAYIKDRGWKSLLSGKKDGFSKTDVWRWYIVKLPG